MNRTPNPRSDWSSRGISLLALVGVVGLLTALLVGYAVVVGDGAEIDASGASVDSPAETTTTSTTAPTTTESTTTTAPTTTTTTTTTTTAPSTTTTTAPPSPPPSTPADGEDTRDHLTVGSEGPEVVALQTRLIELGYYVPTADGQYGGLTQQAVMAFQKIEGLGRDGVAGPQTIAALDGATPPGPQEGGDHVEIDLARQVMFVVRGGQTFIFNTSTGTSGWETPPGRFEITREINGMRHAELGDLWRPKYFNGGIALHGSNSIPGYPASHGCARLHNDVINMIWDAGLAPIGTPVWVY